MMIKATMTNPTTRFCTIAVTPGKLTDKATGSNRRDQRRRSAPSRADHMAGLNMISERSRSPREHNHRPDGRANLSPPRKFARGLHSATGGLRFISAVRKGRGPTAASGQRRSREHLIAMTPMTRDSSTMATSIRSSAALSSACAKSPPAHRRHPPRQPRVTSVSSSLKLWMRPVKMNKDG
jgi:hypothetical protein